MAETFEQIGMEMDGYLDYSFYLSCVAVILSFSVCTPLFMKDEKMPLPTLTQDIPVVFNNQSLVINPSMLQDGTFITSIGQQAVGNLPTCAHAPGDAPPAYTIGDPLQMSVAPPPPFHAEIPFKQ